MKLSWFGSSSAIGFAMIAASAAVLAGDIANSTDTYIVAGKFFDGRSAPVSNVTVCVHGGTISAVGRGIRIPQDARVVDEGQRTVLPGLVDAHTHIALHAGDYDAQILRETPEYRAIYATLNARKTLEAGVTTIRDLGNKGSGFADGADVIKIYMESFEKKAARGDVLTGAQNYSKG